MVQKINRKARINRYLRIFRDNILSDNVVSNKRNTSNYSLLLVIFFVIVIIPIYPRFSSVVHWNTEYDFYRWDIDEESIIDYKDGIDENFDTPILESVDSFISVNTILNTDRDLDWTNEIIDYEVKPWESFYLLSYYFGVSTNSIYWANNFSKDHTLHPWDIIKIPPVSWLIHQVKKWDTIDTIAKEYKVSSEKILTQNLLTIDDELNIWVVLVIPWAKKVVKPEYMKIPVKSMPTKSSNKSKTVSSEYVGVWWKYKLVRRKPKHTFYWWNCTWYVAQYKDVNWWWNANMWLKNAKKTWNLTWNKPVIWAIVVLDWRGYNPRYWHVWIVMDIKDGNIIVVDMNYRRINEVTYRKVPMNNRAIKWYIYVD